MVLRFKKILFLLTCLVIAGHFSAIAQASFTATITPGTIGKNETAELRLMINNASQVEQIIPPSLKDFIILSGPNQESGYENNNGVTRQFIGITYILKPKTKGNFSIEPAIAKADGKTLRSKKLTLVVTNSSTTNPTVNTSPWAGLPGFNDQPVQPDFKDYILKKGENVVDKINKNIFIKVEVNKTTCYVGEPIIVVYKLFTRLKSESSITKNPSFNGFSVIDLLAPGSTYNSIEKLNGRDYNVYTLRKSQLYPLQSGIVELESAEVENNIQFLKEEYIHSQPDALENMLRDFSLSSIPAEALQDEKVTLQSKPVLITVKPLPEKDQSPLFKGAVGSFAISASLEKNSFTTDDAGKLNITISGQGNMPMILAPEIAWPAGVEPYETHLKEQLDQLDVPVSGTKNFEYPFTISNPGKYILPAIDFIFFDVKEARYKKVSTAPLSIEISKGTGKKPAILNESNVKDSKGQFLDILFTNRWLIILPLAILMITGLFIWLQNDKKKQVPVPAINNVAANPDLPEVFDVNEASKIPVNPFILTEEKIIRQDIPGFYEALNNELRKFLAGKLQITNTSITTKTIVAEADRQGVSLNTSQQIQHLLEDIEWQLYTPLGAEDKMQDMYTKAVAIVHALEVTIP